MSPRKKAQGDGIFDDDEQTPKRRRAPKKPAAKKPARTKKKSEKPIDDGFTRFTEDAEDIPVDNFEEQRKKGRKSFRYTRILLLISPWALIGSLLLNFVLVAALVNTALSPEEEVAQQEVQVTEVGRTQAESELQSWLDTEGSAFTGASIASWDGVSDRREVAATEEESAFTELTHNFTIRTNSGEYLRADVRIAYAPDRGAKVISSPSLTPMRASSVNNWEPEAAYSGWTEATASDNVNSAVTSWATALTSDPGELKLQIRDGDAQRVYTTISGVQVKSTHVEQAWTPADSDGASDPDTIAATVSVEVQAEGADESDSETTTIQYDVLIRGANSGAPYVTAWGAVGSGPSLTDYQNGVALSSEDEQDQTDTTGPAASDGGGAEDAATDADAQEGDE